MCATTYAAFGRRGNSIGKIDEEIKKQHYEKKSMKDFIELAWKEMLMLENEENIKARRASEMMKTARSSSLVTINREEKKEKRRASVEKEQTGSKVAEEYDLNKQVKKRIEERAKMSKKLNRDFEDALKKQRQRNEEWIETQSKIKSIEGKCTNFYLRYNNIFSECGCTES